MATQSFGNVEQLYSIGPTHNTKGKVVCQAKAYPCFWSMKWLAVRQGLKLQPTGCQCDWKVRVGNQNFKASHHETTNFQHVNDVQGIGFVLNHQLAPA